MQPPESDNVKSAFVSRLTLKNYKSVAACEVELAPFTALVGPNGAGKSNILDSLRFVADSLRNSLEWALRDRGGIGEVRRRSRGHPTHFSIGLNLNLPSGATATYAFKVGSSKARSFTVQEELCNVWRDGPSGKNVSRYHVRNGELVGASRELPAAIEQDRLYLGVISGIPDFRPVYDALTRMGFYNLSPTRIRELQSPDPAEVLARDGGNIASILTLLQNNDPAAKERIVQYLGTVVPGLKAVDVRLLGPKETIEFRQEVAGDDHPWTFWAASMSDGTLRALGILVALFQGRSVSHMPVPLVGIEEPEASLHPAAANTLASAILEAANFTQVIITSHSPDLLDHEDIPSESILAVVADKGKTIVGPVDNGSREALRDGLYTPGELLRLQQLQPEPATVAQPSLFRDDPLP